jgi:tetratricopeptide (TPR) repeat protein
MPEVRPNPRKPKTKSAKHRSARPPRRPSQRIRRLLVDEVHDYSEADVGRLFHIPGRLLQALARAGYLTPPASEGRTRYSFQDLLILRTAGALKQADIAEPKIIAALGNIRATLPPGSLLNTLALDAGDTWVTSPGRSRGQPPKSAAAAATGTAAFGSTASRRKALLEAQAHYARGHQLEESDVTAAREAYLNALHAHRDHLEARINLGRLLHLDGELQEAEKVYRQAKTSSALLSFNLGILLEDLDREEEAVAAYRDALAQDPTLHDAHFNLSRLHERARRPRDALRHLLAFRRHLQKYGDSSPR